MALRFAWQVWMMAALCIVPQLSTARGGVPSLSDHFKDQPGDAMIHRIQAGPGFSAALVDASAEVLGGRWKISSPDKAQPDTTDVVATDPATGLIFRQKRRWLPKLGFLLIESTLTNSGKTPLGVKSVCLSDWCFRVEDTQGDWRYRDMAYREQVWYGSTYWTGPGWTRVGKDWHHPGEKTPAARRFAVPRDGRITISGRIHKADTKPSDGVRVSIRHHGRTVWKAEIDGPDSRGVEPKITLEVKKGDSIRFVVHKRKAIYCDTTRWDPIITYADGTSFQASKGFSTKRQGDGGWYYEMQVDEQVEAGLPSVHGFSRVLAPRGQTPLVGRPVSMDNGNALPLLVVADGADKSGIVLCLARKSPWRFGCILNRDGLLRLTLAVGGEKGTGPISAKPGETVHLPPMIVGVYRGQWKEGIRRARALIASDAGELELGSLRSELLAAVRHVAAPLDANLEPDAGADCPELDLWMMVQADWAVQDKLDETPDSYVRATALHLERAAQLLDDLLKSNQTDKLAAQAVQLQRVSKLAERKEMSLDERRLLYQRVRWLKRRIILANPLMDFGKLLCTKRVPTSYSHLVMQYFGWRARPGGGICILDEPGRSLACRDILDGKLSGGCVLEPRLSFDGKRIVFSYVECREGGHDWKQLDNETDEGFYHIYEVNVDGTGLRQLTSGPYDDLMPTYLPDGGIAFCSTRRRGYARCFGGQFSRRWHVYTLHRMDGDGQNIRTLSFHDTNEWFPTVSNTGHILYARWDYIDRDAVTHQNLWASRPDGTNPIAVWGNGTPSPHCTFQLQPIPGSNKIIFAASAHHSVAGGSIAIVAPTVSDDGQEAITRITPEIVFPEAEGRHITEYYTAPWPLSEKYYLVGYSPMPLVWEPGANFRNALGLYTLDAFGNRELLYRDPDIGTTNPCPLRPRPVPPVLESQLPKKPRPTGEMILTDIHQGLGDIPRGSIKQLRIIQIFPKTTNVANTPPIGMAREENARAILGTVPVEPDGSARFIVPAQKLILFQALDKDGLVYQTMNSATYLQPGEKVSCVGCHENRMTAPVRRDAMALHRPPSKIDPGPFGGRPFSFVEVVQPVLDKHCVRCHGGEKTEGKIDLTGTPHQGFTKSYVALCGDVNFWGAGTNPENAAKALVPRFGARHQVQATPPGGMYSSLGSRLMKLIRKGHYDAKLTPDDLRRLAAWIDMNATFYGAYSLEDQARQLRGEPLAMPQIQ